MTVALKRVVRLIVAMDAAKRLGVEPVIGARQMADTDVDHIGVMAYAARLQQLTASRSPAAPTPPAKRQSAQPPPPSTMRPAHVTSSSAAVNGAWPSPGTRTRSPIADGPRSKRSDGVDQTGTSTTLAAASSTAPHQSQRKLTPLTDRLRVVLQPETYFTGRRVRRLMFEENLTTSRLCLRILYFFAHRLSDLSEI